MMKFWLTNIGLMLACATTAIGQSTEVLIFQRHSPKEVLEVVQKKTGLTINYVESSLPTNYLSFSTSTDKSEITSNLSQALGRNMVDLDDRTLAITADNFRSTPTTYQGQLLDFHTGEPIIGASVVPQGLELGTVTDVNGRFILKGILSAQHKIEVSYLGYGTKIVRLVELLKASTFLKTKEHVLADVVITSTRLDRNGSSQYVVMSADDLTDALSETDIVEKSQTVAGVYNAGESMNEIQIRGGPPDQVSFEWNGIRLFQNSLFYGRVGAVNPLMVNRVRITKNGANADEDAAASGSILFENKLLHNDSPKIRAQLSGLNTNFSLESNLGQRIKAKVAWRNSLPSQLRTNVYDQYFENSFQFGRLQDLDYYLSTWNGEEYVDFIPSFSFSDLSLTTAVRVHDRSSLNINYINYGNEFTYQSTNIFDDKIGLDRLDLRTEGFSFDWETRWTDRLSTILKGSTSRYRYRSDNYENSNDPEEGHLYQLNNVDQRRIQSEVSYNLGLGSLSLGYEMNEYDVLYEAQSNRPWEEYINTTDDRNGIEHAFYANLMLSHRPWYKLVAGVRHSDFDLALIDRDLIEPRLHLSIFANDRLTLHGHYGVFHQNLNKRSFSTALNVDNRFWLLSDEGVISSNFIHIVQSGQLSVGARYDLGAWRLTADAYTKQAFDVWSSAFDFEVNEDFYEFTTVSIDGFETAISYGKGNYSADFTYEYVNDLVVTRESNVKLQSPYSQPHRLSLIQRLSVGDFDLQLIGRWATGRAYSTGSYLETREKDDGSYHAIVYEDYFNQRVQAYQRWDANVTYHLPLRSKTKVNCTLQFMNLLNKDNILRRQYYINYRPEEPALDFYDQRGLPFTWNFLIDVEF